MYNFENIFMCLCPLTHSMFISTEYEDKLQMGNISDFQPYHRNWSKSDGDWKKGMRKPFWGGMFYILIGVVEVFCISTGWQLHKCICWSQLIELYRTLRNEFHCIQIKSLKLIIWVKKKKSPRVTIMVCLQIICSFWIHVSLQIAMTEWKFYLKIRIFPCYYFEKVSYCL